MIMGGKRMEKYYCHKNQLLSVSERKIREMVAGQKTFTLSEKFSNLENQEKFSGIIFSYLDESGKVFKSGKSFR